MNVRCAPPQRSSTARRRLPSYLARVPAQVDGFSAALSAGFVFLVLFLVYLATATSHGPVSPDPPAAAIPAWQLVAHGNLTLDAFDGMLLWFIDNGERIVSNRTPGVIFFAVPFYWVFGANPDGPNMVPATLAAVTAAAGAMTLLHLLFRRLVRPSTAMAAAFIAGLATSTWSVSADALWAHGPNQLWLAAAMLALATEHYMSSGIGFGLAIFTRPHLAVIAAVAGVWAGVRRRSWRPVVLLGAPALLGLLALVTYNHLVFGGASLTGGYGGYVTSNLAGRPWWHYAEGIAGTLVSPDRGLLMMSPFLLALLPGLGAAWRAAPSWVRSCTVGGVVYMLVQLRINYFSGGNNFFSYRLSIELLMMAAPLLLLAYQEWTARTSVRRHLFSALVCLSVLIQGLGAIHGYVDYVERSAWANVKLWHVAQAAGPAMGGLMAVVAVLAWTVSALHERDAHVEASRP